MPPGLSNEVARHTLPTGVLDWLLRLSLHRAHRKPGNEPVQEQIVDKCNWQAGDQARRHQRAPEVNVTTHQENWNAHTDHLLRLWRDKGQSVNIFLRYQREGEDHNGQNSRQRNWNHHFYEGAK